MSVRQLSSLFPQFVPSYQCWQSSNRRVSRLLYTAYTSCSTDVCNVVVGTDEFNEATRVSMFDTTSLKQCFTTQYLLSTFKLLLLYVS